MKTEKISTLNSEVDELEDDETSQLYEHHRIVADKGQKLLRVDKFLLTQLSGTSRNRVQKAADAGFIMANGKPVKRSYKVKPDDVIQVMLDRPHYENKITPEDIPLDIVYEDGAGGVEEMGRVFQTATGVKKVVGLIGDGKVGTEVIVGFQIVNDLVREMMHIDDYALEATVFKSKDDTLEQRLSFHADQSFRLVVGEGLQAGAKSGCENHCLFHSAKLA